MRQKIAAICITCSLSGCAANSNQIATAYVSPLQYQSYSCEQLAAESGRIHGRASQLAGQLDQASTNDKAIMGVGLILFWPALFALSGSKGQEAEFARFKGEYDAVHQAAILKNCGLQAAEIKAPEKAPEERRPDPFATPTDGRPAFER